ncbi:uncharacterized protein LOC131613504 [Vicia villosa]|uniref:uncharacterized protein LOC131613504 n=1 Tax=Vicia villosa TaxID=3911 RepID=UPI00273B0C66|nr:uncharacterized protein LOC131613504 [Vicia villosa]
MRLPTTASSLSKPRGYQQRQNAQPYVQGWRPENFNRQNSYQQPPPQEKPSKLEETLNQFMQASMANQKTLEQIPKYAKFMKDILTKKKRYTEPETVILDAKCSAIIQCILPRKESDPRGVTLPATIGDIHVGKGLVDLGSSIKYITFSIVKRLSIFDLKATRMTLQLADKSTTRPYGVAEDLLVKVDKFLFPVDFVVIDRKEDIETP